MVTTDDDGVTLCAHCGKEGAMMKCSNCKSAMYCDRECQKGDWKSHKKRCHAEAALMPKDWSKAVGLFSQLIAQNPIDTATLYAKRAQAHLGMGPMTASLATADAQRSCMLQPSQVDGYIIYSKAQFLDHSFWGAEIGVRKGLLQNPTNERLLEQLERVQQARSDPAMRPVVQLRPVYGPRDMYGFIYSHGLYNDGLPELLMVDVPRNKIQKIFTYFPDIVSQLKGQQLSHGEVIEVEQQRVQVLQVSEEVHRGAMIEMVGQWNLETEVTLLKLLDEENTPEPVERETVIPPAPDGNETLLKTVLDKWREVESFTFLVDCVEESEGGWNRMSVPLSYMLVHHKSSVLWDETLTYEEGKYVFDNFDAVRLHARADLDGIGYALDGRYVRNVARNAGRGPGHVENCCQRGIKLASD